MTYQRSYYPKRPVKSFRDLEVYQKALGISTVVYKRLTEELAKSKIQDKKGIAEKAIDLLLHLPVLIASSHSVRFGKKEEATAKLEEAMLGCNLAVVYLEQFRDLTNKNIEADFFEEQIKNLLTVRVKIMHLQRSWVKFTPNQP